MAVSTGIVVLRLVFISFMTEFLISSHISGVKFVKYVNEMYICVNILLSYFLIFCFVA